MRDTPLTDNVHFEDMEIVRGKIVCVEGHPWGYAYDEIKGGCRVLRFTHPEVPIDAYIRRGDYMRYLRLAREGRGDNNVAMRRRKR